MRLNHQEGDIAHKYLGPGALTLSLLSLPNILILIAGERSDAGVVILNRPLINDYSKTPLDGVDNLGLV